MPNATIFGSVSVWTKVNLECQAINPGGLKAGVNVLESIRALAKAKSNRNTTRFPRLNQLKPLRRNFV